MNESTYSELRADGRVVVDFPGRKVVVYPNTSGHVVLMCQDGDERVFQMIAPEEVSALCAALLRAGIEAKPISDAIESEYHTHVAIEMAKGGAA